MISGQETISNIFNKPKTDYKYPSNADFNSQICVDVDLNKSLPTNVHNK